MQIIYGNNTEVSVFNILILLSNILGGIDTIVLLILFISAIIVSFNNLRRIPYEDGFQIKKYTIYKEYATYCVFLFWFLSVEVLYFLTYNIGSFIEHFVSSHRNITIGTNCTMEQGTFLSESFSTDSITLASNLVSSLHTSLNVYYLEIVCIILLYYRMGLKEKLDYRKLIKLAIISTVYWVATLILYILPWTVSIGYAVIIISSQIFIVILIKQTRKLLRELRFKKFQMKIQYLALDNRKSQLVIELTNFQIILKNILSNIIAAFQLQLLNCLIIQMPFYFIQNIALNSCYYKVVYGVEIPACIENILNLIFNQYEFAVLIIQELCLCIFFLLMNPFYIHLTTVLLIRREKKRQLRFGGTASLNEPLLYN